MTQWPPAHVVLLRAKLDELESVMTTNHDSDLAPILARFLVVRSSGYLEQAVNEILRSFVLGKSGGLVQSFAHSWLERSRNPTPENLGDLVGRFDAAHREDFAQLLAADDDRLQRELSFLVDRRNKIAHGLNEGISSSKALSLKMVAVEVSDWFILRFNPL